MAALDGVYTFFENADAHASFLHRVEVALYEKALDLRENPPASPLAAVDTARQLWAMRILDNPIVEARRFLPGMSIKANNAGFINDQGVLTATDAQIRTTVAALITVYSGYIPT
jgi:hypothetical protein